MRRTIWTLILLAIAGGIAYGSRRYPGLAQFNWAGFQVNMSIYVFALLQLMMVGLLLLLWRFYRTIMNAPARYGAWRAQKREYRALAAVTSATLALQEGRWAHAEKAAKIASRSPQSKGIASLLGAASAQARQQPDAAQVWLAQLDGDDKFEDAKALQMAQIAIDQNDANTALTELEKVSNGARKHSVRYRELLIQSHAKAQHWHDVLQMAKDKKWTAPLAVKNAWFSQAAIALSADENSSISYLQTLYKDMPDDVRADDAVLNAYLTALLQRQELLLVRRAVEEAQKHSWRPKLLDAYVQASDESSQIDQLKQFDAWEVKQGAEQKDAGFLCAAGQVCLKTSIWGRAKSYFQASLAVAPTVKAHYGLAQTHRAIGELEQAQEEERKAATLAVSEA